MTQSVSITESGLVLPPLSGFVIDGTVDAGYGCPVAVQQLSTTLMEEYRDEFLSALPGGSELDAAYGLVLNNTLFLLLAGNIQDNGNRVHIFFMTGPGGQNTLTNVNPNGFDPSLRACRESVDIERDGTEQTALPGPGLTFDPGLCAQLLHKHELRNILSMLLT